MTKDNLKFDTDFFEKSATAKSGVGSVAGSSQSNKWKPWLVGGVIVFGVIIMAAASDSSGSSAPSAASDSTYSFSSTNSTGDITVGRYRCSSSNARRAEELEPDIPEATIQAESDALDRRIAALEAWGNRIENMYVDEYDQYSIDNYNNQVDSYNSTRDKLNFEIGIYEAKLPRYNSQVGIYNSFLEDHCTKAY